MKQLEAEEIFNRALDTNGVPYHSAVLQPLLPELTQCAADVESCHLQLLNVTHNESASLLVDFLYLESIAR